MNTERREARTVRRFWAKVRKLPGRSACWEWTGCLVRGRVPQFRIRDRKVSAQWYSLRLAGTRLPAGAIVMRACFNRACVRPEHLRTAQQRDTGSVGRRSPRWSVQIHRVKLDAESARFIRGLYARGIAATRLARAFDVSVETVYRVTSQRRWKEAA